jgi:hypothetical protein
MVWQKPGDGKGWLWDAGNIFALILCVNLALIYGVLREPNTLDEERSQESIQAGEWARLVKD